MDGEERHLFGISFGLYLAWLLLKLRLCNMRQDWARLRKPLWSKKPNRSQFLRRLCLSSNLGLNCSSAKWFSLEKWRLSSAGLPELKFELGDLSWDGRGPLLEITQPLIWLSQIFKRQKPVKFGHRGVKTPPPSYVTNVIFFGEKWWYKAPPL